MAISGAGAGINELTALAATSEMAPTRKRGKYVAIRKFCSNTSGKEKRKNKKMLTINLIQLSSLSFLSAQVYCGHN